MSKDVPQRRVRAVLSASVAALLLAAVPHWIATASAEDAGKGYEYCYTNYPDATGYIAGQPTYVSAVFAYSNNSYNGPALATYVSKKYGVKNPGPVGCSYSSVRAGVQKKFDDDLAKLKAAGTRVVETGWTLAGSAADPAPKPSSANDSGASRRGSQVDARRLTACYSPSIIQAFRS
jgi:hypothetical protein